MLAQPILEDLVGNRNKKSIVLIKSPRSGRLEPGGVVLFADSCLDKREYLLPGIHSFSSRVILMVIGLGRRNEKLSLTQHRTNFLQITSKTK